MTTAEPPGEDDDGRELLHTGRTWKAGPVEDGEAPMTWDDPGEPDAGPGPATPSRH